MFTQTYYLMMTKRALPYRILFFGSDAFSATCLQTMLDRLEIKSCDVVVPFGGSHLMESVASKRSLKVFKAPQKSLKSWQIPSSYDLAVVISFGYFIPASVLKEFKLGGINVHPSLLPKYRGSSPIQYTILNQDPITGVSIIDLSSKSFDSGKILKQERVDICHPISYKVLHDSLAKKGAEMLCKVLENFEDFSLHSREQLLDGADPSNIPKAPKIEQKFARILWKSMSSKEIYHRYLAIGEKIPLFSIFNRKEKKIQFTQIEDPNLSNFSHLPPEALPGYSHYEKQVDPYSLYVKTKDSWLCMKKVRVQDKREIDAKQFYNGYGMGIMFGES